jgi:hypothetical protein
MKRKWILQGRVVSGSEFTDAVIDRVAELGALIG